MKKEDFKSTKKCDKHDYKFGYSTIFHYPRFECTKCLGIITNPIHMVFQVGLDIIKCLWGKIKNAKKI